MEFDPLAIHKECPNCKKYFSGFSPWCSRCTRNKLQNEKRSVKLEQFRKGARDLLVLGENPTDIVVTEECYAYTKSLFQSGRVRSGVTPLERMECLHVGHLAVLEKITGKNIRMDVWLSEGLPGDEMYIFDRLKMPAPQIAR